MDHTPRIGIPTVRHEMGFVLPVYTATAHYIDSLRAAGGLPVLLPVCADTGAPEACALVRACDGFLLPGGGDFDPRLYGQEPLPGQAGGSLSLATQEAALRLVRAAVDSGRPVLGVCLGMQLLNIALGGDLWQDIPSQLGGGVCHDRPAKVTADRWQVAHTVRLAPGSLLRQAAGEGTIGVNSFHHQAVKTLGAGLTATAWAPDGVVEAVEHGARPVLGVQWHPENLAVGGVPHAQALFRWLVRAAGA